MSEAITFTWGQIVTGFLAVCAGISCVAGAVGWVVKVFKAAKAPAKKVDERITSLEKDVREFRQYFANDKGRIDTMEDGNRIMQRAMLALLSHGIDGNDVESLKAAKNELQQFLIER